MLMKSVVGVAQLVEPRIVIPVVVGSSPIVHPTDTFYLIPPIASLQPRGTMGFLEFHQETPNFFGASLFRLHLSQRKKWVTQKALT